MATTDAIETIHWTAEDGTCPVRYGATSASTVQIREAMLVGVMGIS